MRREVVAMLSLHSGKKGLNLYPKGIGHVASRPWTAARAAHPRGRFVSGFAVACAEGGPQGDCVSQRLHVDAPEFGVCGFVVGVVGLATVGPAFQRHAQDYQTLVWQATRAGGELSGVRQAVAEVDRPVACCVAAGVPSTHARGAQLRVAGGTVARVCRRWQPRGRAAHAEKRRALLAQVQAFARGAKKATSSPASARSAGSTRAEGERSADLADGVVACGKWLALGMARRSLRQQRTEASGGNACRVACRCVDYCGRRLCRLRAVAEDSRRRTSSAGARGEQRAVVEEAGIRPRTQRPGLSLARCSLGKATTAPRAAADRGAQWTTSDVLSDERDGCGQTVRCTGRKDLRSSLGNRVVLSALQTNLRALQAAQPESRQCHARTALVAVGNVGVGTALTPSAGGAEGRGGRAHQFRWHPAGVSRSHARVPEL